MKKHLTLIFGPKDEWGAIAIVVSLIIVVLLSFAALAIDVGYTFVTRGELQNTADAAALAAARRLGAIYEPMSYQEQQTYVCDPATIIPVAKEIAEKNQAGGKNVLINDADVVIGIWDAESKTLTPTLDQPDAVRVTARRDDSANGPITTFFARIFGVDSVAVSAIATAALTGQSTAYEGGLRIPVGISEHWFEKPEYCEQPIKFNPTGTLEGCAGWHTFKDWPASNNREREILIGMTGGTYQSPETVAGEAEFAFIGGNLGEQAFLEMQALFDANKSDEDNDPATPDTWTTAVAVYGRDDCSNPNKETVIVGFSTAIITQVIGPPDMVIEAKVLCNSVQSGRGGGGYYGTKGSIPGLVE